MSNCGCSFKGELTLLLCYTVESTVFTDIKKQLILRKQYTVFISMKQDLLLTRRDARNCYDAMKNKIQIK